MAILTMVRATQITTPYVGPFVVQMGERENGVDGQPCGFWSDYVSHCLQGHHVSWNGWLGDHPGIGCELCAYFPSPDFLKNYKEKRGRSRITEEQTYEQSQTKTNIHKWLL